MSDCKLLAWGGIELCVPQGWEPGRIGRDHLLLESGAGPAMEIKWAARGRGLPPGGPPLRRLARNVRRQGGAFRELPLPTAWQRALPGYEGAAFEWDAGGQRAGGACVRCRECGGVSLVQFFERGAAGWDERAARVLSSLADHRRDGCTRWRVFDISAVLPCVYRLVDSRFRAGCFELRFRQARRALTLWRWAPAGALLQGKTLSEFAASAVGDPGLRFEPARVSGCAGAAAADPLPGGVRGWIADRFGLARRRAARVWHVAGGNRVLGVRMQGPARGLDRELEEICAAYGVDETTSASFAGVRP